MVDEIKRIIKTSEIMKYGPVLLQSDFSLAYILAGKMIASGPRRIRMDDRSWRYD